MQHSHETFGDWDSLAPESVKCDRVGWNFLDGESCDARGLFVVGLKHTKRSDSPERIGGVLRFRQLSC